MSADSFGNWIGRQGENGEDDRINKNTEIDAIIVKAKIFCKVIGNSVCWIQRTVISKGFNTTQKSTYIYWCDPY